MVDDNKLIKESSSIIEEIESQLQDVLEKRKKAVEEELEEKIRLAQEEAKKRKSELENQLKSEQDALINYKNVLSEFESSKENVKGEIKTHLDKAIQLQTEIEEKTALSLDELKTVSDLTQKLEGINSEASEKVHALKSELEEKFGIVAQVPDSIGQAEVDFDLETELQKLQKIKELLGTPGTLDEAEFGIKKKPGVPTEAAPEDIAPEEIPGEAKAEPETTTEVETEAEVTPEAEKPPEDTAPEETNAEVEEAAEEPPSEEAAGETPPEESKASEPTPAEEAAPPVEAALSPELEQYKDDEAVRKAIGALAAYRQSESLEEGGEVVYYQKGDTLVLESENLLLTVSEAIDQAKQFYIKLSDTESPKEQFFIKQEIIKYQDNLRKRLLSNIRWSEKDNCSLPKFSKEVINPIVLKTLLEKVSMENWSNKDDFSSFENFIKELKDNYYKLLSPPDKYFEGILDQLEKC
jgi:hypothetical protein